MRAAIFSEHGGPEVVRVADVPDPVPGPGEVRIAVRAAAMNHLDLWVRRGLPIETTMPHIGGSDIAGVVDSVGPGVDAGLIGTPVVVDPSLDYDWYATTERPPGLPAPAFRIIGEHTQGGFAELVTVPAANLLAVPEDVALEIAAAASLVSVTAWRGIVTRGAVRPGERVLITAASGGVGTMAVQIARLAGARVYAVTSGAENVERIRGLGAHVVYDRLEVDHSREVWKDTAKKGVDVVFDSVGESNWEGNLRALARGGRLVSYGATTGPKGATDIRVLFWKQASILGTTMGTPEEYRTVMRLVFQGAIRPVIDRVLALDEARKAHELLESGAVFGKVVLKP